MTFDGKRVGRKRLASLGLAAACALLAAVPSAAAPQRQTADRTLRVLASNPRYFTDGSGRPVYLTGSHVWWNLVGDQTWDFCLHDPAAPFSYDAYLRDLARHGHNFVRCGPPS